MRLPATIPAGARLVVRIALGPDPEDGRPKFRDYIGHVVDWNGRRLILDRDPAANGSRPGERVTLQATDMVALKPVPERRSPRPDPPNFSR